MRVENNGARCGNEERKRDKYQRKDPLDKEEEMLNQSLRNSHSRKQTKKKTPTGQVHNYVFEKIIPQTLSSW